MSRRVSSDAWDVVVVGGGGCGLSAAVAAAEEGARVRVLEKHIELGGNTARSVGSVPGAGTRLQQEAGVSDSPMQFYDDLHALTSGDLDVPRTRQLCELSAGLVHWLIDRVGAPLRLTEDYKHVGHSVNRLHNPPSREGAELIRDLHRAAERLGVMVETSREVTGIEQNDRCVEVAAEDEVLYARAVVLATDGFGASDSMKQEHCPEAARLAYFGAPGNTGDGIRWGIDLGARLANMRSYLGYAVMAVPPSGPPSFETLFSWTVVEIGGFIVDLQGRRFANEDSGYSAFCDAVLREASDSAFVVFDQRRLDYVSTYEQRFRLLVERPDTPVVRADDVDSLAQRCGLPTQTLRATLGDHDAAAAGRAPDLLGRSSFGLGPLAPPFYACPTRPGLLTTQGGLVVNEHAQVVLVDGSALPNVYAGGSTAVGISGSDGAQGYASGNGLLTALGYGFLAGRHAAKHHAARA